MSAILQHAHRPWCVFDPSNADHRRYFAEFLKNHSWGRCPVRFYVPEEAAGDLMLMIHNKLARWYTSREFGSGQTPASENSSMKSMG